MSTGRVIVVTSGKGGVGKTTTTANIGMALASMGEKVALVDADIGLRNLDLVLGLENRIVYNLVDVVEGRAKLKQARYTVTFDRDFEAVIAGCAGRREGRWHLTWITPRIMRGKRWLSW